MKAELLISSKVFPYNINKTTSFIEVMDIIARRCKILINVIWKNLTPYQYVRTWLSMKIIGNPKKLKSIQVSKNKSHCDTYTMIPLSLRVFKWN